ncbi:MAG: hypothetical protein Q9227_007090 [Pyrenula ochraceoflavens]
MKVCEKPGDGHAIHEEPTPRSGSRSLGKTNKQTAGRLSSVDTISLTADSERENAIELLKRYYIFKDTTDKAKAKAFSLTPDFARSLRLALTGGGNHRSFGELYTDTSRPQISVSDLDTFARNQWEGILSYMVGNSANIEMDLTSANNEPSRGVIELLKMGHFIEVLRGKPKITKEGFAFVLQDINTQVWALLFIYVENAESLQMTKVEILSFLFLVSSLELGKSYSSESLNETQRRILADLNQMGIVYLPPATKTEITANCYYPTRLAVTLTSDSTSALASVSSTLSSSLHSSSTSGSTAGGFIIIETNYRLYAYTSSPLQISLLALFVNLRSRHPNLVTGKMTKSSVQRAVHMGITAEQIISYLSTHAHPQMRRHAALEAANNANTTSNSNAPTDTQTSQPHHSILPPTIIDQINLWQIERDRMTATAGFLFKDFPNQDEYEKPMRYADEVGVLLWKSNAKRMFFVSRVEQVAQYMKQRREGAA